MSKRRILRLVVTQPLQLVLTRFFFAGSQFSHGHDKTQRTYRDEVYWTKAGPFFPHDFGIRPTITAPRTRVSLFRLASVHRQISDIRSARKITTCENSHDTHTHAPRTHRGSSNQIPARHCLLLRLIQM